MSEAQAASASAAKLPKGAAGAAARLKGKRPTLLYSRRPLCGLCCMITSCVFLAAGCGWTIPLCFVLRFFWAPF